MIKAMARKKSGLTAKEGALVHQLGPPPGWVPLTEEELQDELVRRIEAIESGKVKTVPLDVAMRRIKAKLRRLRGSR